jgi:WD repeat-containing protein 68
MPAAQTGQPSHYVYETPAQSYALAWARRDDPCFRLAIGSFCDKDNTLQVVEKSPSTGRLVKIAETSQDFPPTKVMWKPTDSILGSATESLDGQLLVAATTQLDIRRLQDGHLKKIGTAAVKRKEAKEPPITSFDWSQQDEAKIGMSLLDTTACITDIVKNKAEFQLIAHDSAVYDFAFGWSSIFGSVGADGSLRVFDQRNLSVSTIMYETDNNTPLMRLAWNKLDKNYIATISDTAGVTICDMRKPSVCVKELSSCGYNGNCIAWCPDSRHHLIWGTDCGKALIWDMRREPDTMVTYESDKPVYQVEWPTTAADHVALGLGNRIEVLRT